MPPDKVEWQLFSLIAKSHFISVDFVDSKTRLGKLKASFRLLSLLI